MRTKPKVIYTWKINWPILLDIEWADSAKILWSDVVFDKQKDGNMMPTQIRQTLIFQIYDTTFLDNSTLFSPLESMQRPVPRRRRRSRRVRFCLVMCPLWRLVAFSPRDAHFSTLSSWPKHEKNPIVKEPCSST